MTIRVYMLCTFQKTGQVTTIVTKIVAYRMNRRLLPFRHNELDSRRRNGVLGIEPELECVYLTLCIQAIAHQYSCIYVCTR